MSSSNSQNVSGSPSINEFYSRRNSSRRSRKTSDDEDFVADKRIFGNVTTDPNSIAKSRIESRSASSNQLVNYEDPSSESEGQFEYDYEIYNQLESNAENHVVYEQNDKIEHIFLSRESDQGIEYLVTFQNSDSPFAQWILAVILDDFPNFSRMLKTFNETEMKMSFYNTFTTVFEVSYNSPLHIISHRKFSENLLEFLFEFELETGTAFFWEIGNQSATANLISHYLETLVCVQNLVVPSRKNEPRQKANLSLANPYVQNINTQSLLPRPQSLHIEYSEANKYESVDHQIPREYQIDGVNWLLSCFCKGHGSILADEMGLGKTIQSLVFLMKLNEDSNFHGPHLIAVRTNTYNQWCSEIERWCNMKIKYIAYQGDPKTRDLIRLYQFPAIDKDGNRVPNAYGFNILLATYEIVLKDADVLKDIDWQVIVVDEGHRIKNSVGKKHKAFESFSYQHRIILTGTPIQNSLKELFTLLNFVSPQYFQDESIFPEDDIESLDESVLHSLFLKISPHLMRRSLLSVEHSIIPKEERVAFLHMTKEQMELTRLNKLHALDRISQNSEMQSESSSNQRICNHPFLINGAEEFYTNKYSKLSRLDLLIQTSSKFMFLDKILPIIKQSNRSVLLFSQRLKSLRLLEEYCKLKKYKSVMLIGDMSESEKNDAINAFSDPDSDVFIFLISTRSGSEGLNLTKASFTIIFDPDWNPQNDLQAQARCHRIGQTQKVDVLRLITYGSYEHEMFSRAQRKLSLWLSLFGDGSESKEDQVNEVLNSSKLHRNRGEFDSMMNPLKRDENATEFVSNIQTQEIMLDQSIDQLDKKESVKLSESTVQEPPFIQKYNKNMKFDTIEEVLNYMATVVTEERMPIVSQEQIPIQDLSMGMTDEQFIQKFPRTVINPLKAQSTGLNKKGRPVMEKVYFDPKMAKQVLVELDRVGYGQWEKIYDLIDESLCSFPLFVRFCQAAILLYFRACNPSRISNFPLLIRRLLNDRPDFDFSMLVCADVVNDWYVRGEASVCKQIRGHMFKTSFNFLSILEFHLLLDTYIEFKSIKAENADNQEENETEDNSINDELPEFHFDQLPPYHDSRSNDKAIYERLLETREFTFVTSRMYQIFNLMKYELIQNFDAIKDHVYTFNFWTKSELNSLLSMIRNYGNFVTPQELHPKSGLLSKAPSQMNGLPYSIFNYFSTHKTFTGPIIIPTMITNNQTYAPIPILKCDLYIEATDATIVFKRICIFMLIKEALRILQNSFSQTPETENDESSYIDPDSICPDGKGWWTYRHCEILFENLLKYGLDNLSNILISPDFCFKENLTGNDIEMLTSGLYSNAPIMNLNEHEEGTKIPHFLTNDNKFYAFLRQLCHPEEKKIEKLQEMPKKNEVFPEQFDTKKKAKGKRGRKKSSKQTIQFFLPKTRKLTFSFNVKTRYAAESAD